MTDTDKKKFYRNLPETPGVYLMKDKLGKILYIGKAANLKRRVSSYFTRPPAYNAYGVAIAGRHDSRIEKLVSEIGKVDHKKTDTALEALILEAALIKKYFPPYNIRDKDDKSFLYFEITKEKFPRVLLVRGKSQAAGERYGPFTSASNAREALRIIRKIFPFSIHPSDKIGKSKRPCFDYQVGLCPGVCLPVSAGGGVDRKEYLKNIRNIRLLFQGRKEAILKKMEREMSAASKQLKFEKAAKLRGKIFALRHIQDVAIISEDELKTKDQESKIRIEGYDVSNISGTSAIGGMVVFVGESPDKSQYRSFKIKTIKKSDDVGMLKETLRRRLGHAEWPLPVALLVDGGKGQVNGVKEVLDEFGLGLPVVGIAKGAKRKKNEFIGEIPEGLSEKVFIRVRDEAHRFAKNRHEKLRSRAFL